MKTYFLLLFACFFIALSLSAKEKNPDFTENKGQVHDQNGQSRPDVLFSGMTGALTFHLRNTGISYQLERVISVKESVHVKTGIKKEVPETSMIQRVDINWPGCRPDAETFSEEELPGNLNFYLASCPDGVLNVKTYGGVWYRNIYSGIDLHYYGKNGALKYDYLVQPGADYKQIRLAIEGATSVELQDDGGLLLRTPLGDIREGAPLVYQNTKKLDAAWKISGKVLCFEIKNYDKSQPLVIDPVVRIWGTYYGGSGTEVAESCATDALGNVIMSGGTSTGTGTMIATSGAYQSVIAAAGVLDAFLVKFNQAGVRQWGTYYGGSGNEDAFSCTSDASGNIYLAGSTSSTAAAIASPGSHQNTYGGGSEDAFLAKFTSSGVRIWATFYGGMGSDIGMECVIGGNGNVYLTGNTDSQTGISSAGCHQAGIGSTALSDAFLACFDQNGTRLWATYYGGSGVDQGNSCSVDNSNNIYMAGNTRSGGLSTPGSHQPSLGGVQQDGYVVKFNSTGIRQWASYYGGTGIDNFYSCRVDKQNNIYAAGLTNSSGSQVTSSTAHQSVSGGSNDGLVVKFSNTGGLHWATLYGGTDLDVITMCFVDAFNDLYIAGYSGTKSGTVIATPGSYQASYGGGFTDAFLARFDPAGVRSFGTYYGDILDDYIYGGAADPFGKIYISGQTGAASGTVLGSSNGFQPSQVPGSFQDGFLGKFGCEGIDLKVSSTQSVLCLGSDAVLSASGASSYSWNTSDATATLAVSPTVATTYTVTGSDTEGCRSLAVFTQSVTDCTNLADEKQAYFIEVYPNPSKGLVNFLLSNGKSVTVDVYNGIGQKILSQLVSSSDPVLNMAECPAGIYYLKVSTSDDMKLIKLIRE